MGPRNTPPDSAPVNKVGDFMRRHAGVIPAILVALAFFVVGLLTLEDYGITWDEEESYRAGMANLHLIGNALRGESVVWPWHELYGYQFLFDTFRGAVALGLNHWLWKPGAIYGFHLFNLLLATAILLLVFLIGRKVSGEPATGWLAAAVLALHPKFVAHSQANPKDLIGVFVITLCVWLMERAARSGGWRPLIALGAGLGFALANHIASLVLYPLAGLWLLLANGVKQAGSFLRVAVVWLVSLPVAFLCWPWLWADPGHRILNIMDHIRRFSPRLHVLYLGRIYDPHSVPWHYSLVSFVVATPLLLIGAMAAGTVRFTEKTPEIRRLVVLALLWAGFVFGAEALGTAHYDGVRHVLAALPALALLAGAGLSWTGRGLWRLFRDRRYGLAAGFAVVLVGALSHTLIQLAALHPYHDAYLNEAVRAAVGPRAEDTFELEYWGFTYKEASKWLNANAPQGAVISIPMAVHAMAPWLRRDLRPFEGVQLRPFYTRPYYLVVMTRRAIYGAEVKEVRGALRPVFTIDRQGSTLLEIYRLDTSPIRQGKLDRSETKPFKWQLG